MNLELLLTKTGAPWNYSEAEKIKDYYRNNPVDWDLIRNRLEAMLEVVLQAPVPSASPFNDEQEQYLSFTLQSISQQIPLLDKPDKAVFREELIRNGIKEPSDKDVSWLFRSWIDYVLYSHIETVFSFIHEHRDSQQVDWLLPVAEPYLTSPHADAYLGVKILGDTFDIMGEKTLPLLDAVARNTAVPALAEQGEALRKLLTYGEQTGK